MRPKHEKLFSLGPYCYALKDPKRSNVPERKYHTYYSTLIETRVRLTRVPRVFHFQLDDEFCEKTGATRCLSLGVLCLLYENVVLRKKQIIKVKVYVV